MSYFTRIRKNDAIERAMKEGSTEADLKAWQTRYSEGQGKASPAPVTASPVPNATIPSKSTPGAAKPAAAPARSSANNYASAIAQATARAGTPRDATFGHVHNSSRTRGAPKTTHTSRGLASNLNSKPPKGAKVHVGGKR